MNERPSAPTEDTKKLQREAGNPQSSAWISANAGSGKTYILTERVLRILLTGVKPEEILCLTYTKAAAAEMKSRVAERLAEWAVADDAKLSGQLRTVARKEPDADLMQRARALFAHALETPGGLKINTIHAFCEAVLQRFPLEAGVPVGFSVIEDTEQADLIRHAIDQVLAEGMKNHLEVGEAVATLFAVMSDHQIDTAIHDALAKSRPLRDVLADPATARQNLINLLGVDANLTRDQVEAEVLGGGGFGQAEAAAVMAITPPDPTKNRFEDKLARLDWATRSADDWFKCFLTQAGEVPKRGLPKGDITKADPVLGDAISDEVHRLAALYEQARAADILAASTALLTVLSAVNTRYQNAKRLNNWLDFDDLIARLVTLLDIREARDWVRYKLDSGITHILVDESQDTNPDQWRVVTQLSEEFFTGQGAVERFRTIFAVGDEKQSIYSFQGAVPALFGETGTDIGQRARGADLPFVKDAFRASFRTLENILNAVDLVSKDPEVGAGLLLDEKYRGHESARKHRGGTVTLWPPVVPADDEPAEDNWPETPRMHQKTPPNRLAERIVTQIADWLTTERHLPQRGRPVTTDDILILVQTRGPLFSAIISELKRRNIPTPGADRVSVTGHIITDDLLALADILNDPSDDLGLAALLRSPLFRLTESEIFDLAHGRKNHALWSRLRDSKAPNAIAAFGQLNTWRNQLDFERPYEFFARVLFAEGGLQKFRQRLSAEIDDVIAEFLELALAHEQSAQPGLLGFVAEMRARDVAIKRELAETGRGVRVMTVHGAKGLEAPVVVLADAASSRPSTGPVYVEGQPHPMLAHIASKPAHTETTLAALRQPDEDRQKQESWRMLYVGMTRAEDELYVTGFLNKKGANSKIDGTWYDKVEQALHEDCVEEDIAGEADVMALRYPRELPNPAPHQDMAARPDQAIFAMPDLSPPADPVIIETISPSRVGHKDAALETALQTAASASTDEELIARDPDLARRRGTALHALLQHLEKVPSDIQPRVALDALKTLLADHPGEHQVLADKALSIITGEHATTFFGPKSRAELPFLLAVDRNGAEKRLVGRIDRAIVEQDSVLLVDFKSDAQPASSPEQVPPAYLTQLALYRLAGKKLFAGKLIRAALFWTADETLVELPSNLLDAAIDGYTLK